MYDGGISDCFAASCADVWTARKMVGKLAPNDRMTSVGTCKNLPSRDPKHDKHSDHASGTGGTSCQLCLDIAPPNDRNQSKNNADLQHLVSLQTSKKQADRHITVVRIEGTIRATTLRCNLFTFLKLARRADLHGGNHYDSKRGVKQGDILAFRKWTWSTFSWHDMWPGSHSQHWLCKFWSSRINQIEFGGACCPIDKLVPFGGTAPAPMVRFARRCYHLLFSPRLVVNRPTLGIFMGFNGGLTLAGSSGWNVQISTSTDWTTRTPLIFAFACDMRK